MDVAAAAFSIAAEQLIKHVLYTAQHVKDFDHQLRVMKLNLVHIKALLDANADNKPKNYKNEADERAIQMALSEFTDSMYMADDILTDCLIRCEYHGNGYFSNFLPQNLYFHLRTSSKMEDINKRIKTTCKILDSYLRLAGGGNSSNEDNIDKPCDDYELSESDEPEFDEPESDKIVGLEDDVEMIKNWILSWDSNDLHTIGIVGMGGLGKTTLANIIFNNVVIRSHFDKKIMVSVSQMFKEEAILRSISRQLGEKSSKKPSEEASSGKNKLGKILSRLNQNSFLMILDDIWDEKEHLKWWKEKFFSPLEKSKEKRCCIIITTRDKKVASHIQVNKEHKPQLLSQKHSWSLFSKHAFSSINERRLDVGGYEVLGREIVDKCGGLPLAIKTIGGMLGRTCSPQEWHETFEGFCERNFTEQNEVVMASLNLSFMALPVHLKRCLLCFSIYPEDHVIRAQSLVHWWMVEGLIQAKGRKTATDLGFEYLSNLVSRCLVEVVDRQESNGRVYSCKMHDLVRELTLIMANQEKLCRSDGQESIQEARWFCCTSEDQAKSLNQSPKLRALLMLRMDKTKIDKSLCSLTSLRALDLSDNKLDKDSLKILFSWISYLKRLAYLNLSQCEYLKQVPGSICKLLNLKFLILAECPNLYNLSPKVSYLKRLVVLNLKACNNLQYLPRGVEKLTHLEELHGLNLQQNKKSCHLVEIEKLKNLRVLQIKLSKDSEITKQESQILQKHEKLRVLSIDFGTDDWGETDMREMVNKISPPAELKEVYLRRYYHSNLPEWVNAKSLPRLLYLRIEEGLVADIPTHTAYCSLLRLCLNKLHFLKADWNQLIEKMPLLHYAKIKGCSDVTNYPGDPISGIWIPSQRQLSNES